MLIISKGDYMREEEYKIKITKPSKYKRIDGWCEDGGSLTPEQIEYIINMDRIDTCLEQGIELTAVDKEYLATGKTIAIQKICDCIDSEDELTINERTSTPYTGTKNNKIGVIRDVTIEDLENLDKSKGEK